MSTHHRSWLLSLLLPAVLLVSAFAVVQAQNAGTPAAQARSTAPGPEPDGGTARRSTRPLTGDEYVESIRDSREIYLYGDRVRDVTTHPAFRNPVRMTARLYDALHDPQHRAELTGPTDSGRLSTTRPSRAVFGM